MPTLPVDKLVDLALTIAEPALTRDANGVYDPSKAYDLLVWGDGTLGGTPVLQTLVNLLSDVVHVENEGDIEVTITEWTPADATKPYGDVRTATVQAAIPTPEGTVNTTLSVKLTRATFERAARSARRVLREAVKD